ncbi:hypothetical protein LINPERHAP2_LOCUS40986 [Linum perenne]
MVRFKSRMCPTPFFWLGLLIPRTTAEQPSRGHGRFMIFISR